MITVARNLERVQRGAQHIADVFGVDVTSGNICLNYDFQHPAHFAEEGRDSDPVRGLEAYYFVFAFAIL